MSVSDKHTPTAEAEAREATTLKVADIIRALVEAEEKDCMRQYSSDFLCMELVIAEYKDNFNDLLRQVEEMADHGSADCQYIIMQFRENYINNRS